MRRIVTADAAQVAADIVAECLAAKPDAHLCLPTGATPEPLYAELVRRRLDWSQARLTKLDEWLGLPPTHPATCEAYLQDRFLGPIGYRGPWTSFRSDAGDPEDECRRIREALDAPFDLCILGIGLNGHLGLLEPADELPRHAHPVTLAEESRRHGMLAELPVPPTQGMTLGIVDLLGSRRILLMATGERKAAVVRRLMTGDVGIRFPASLLHLHPACDFVCGAECA